MGWSPWARLGDGVVSPRVGAATVLGNPVAVQALTAAARSPAASLDRHQNPEQDSVAPTRGETHLITGPQV